MLNDHIFFSSFPANFFIDVVSTTFFSVQGKSAFHTETVIHNKNTPESILNGDEEEKEGEIDVVEGTDESGSSDVVERRLGKQGQSTLVVVIITIDQTNRNQDVD